MRDRPYTGTICCCLTARQRVCLFWEPSFGWKLEGNCWSRLPCLRMHAGVALWHPSPSWGPWMVFNWDKHKPMAGLWCDFKGPRKPFGKKFGFPFLQKVIDLLLREELPSRLDPAGGQESVVRGLGRVDAIEHRPEVCSKDRGQETSEITKTKRYPPQKKRQKKQHLRLQHAKPSNIYPRNPIQPPPFPAPLTLHPSPFCTPFLI